MVKRIRGTPVEVGHANVKQNRIGADWGRLATTKEQTIFIDDVPLQKLAKSYAVTDREFSKPELKKFFQENILNKILDANVKAQAADYLMNTFHQGGWMELVDAPLMIAMGELGLNLAKNGGNKSLRIQTNSTGFSVTQEVDITNVIAVENPYAVIGPENDSNFVIRAQASAKLSFSANKIPERADVYETVINFGNKAIESRLGGARSIMQKIIDWVMSLFEKKIQIIEYKDILKKSRLDSSPEVTSETPEGPKNQP